MADWMMWTIWGVVSVSTVTLFSRLTLAYARRRRWVSHDVWSMWRRRVRVLFALTLLTALALPFFATHAPGLGIAITLGLASLAIASSSDEDAAEFFELG